MPESSVSAPTLVVIDGEGSARTMGSSGPRQPIEPGVRFDGFYVAASGNRNAVLAISDGEHKKLVSLAADGSFKTIHEHGVSTEYSVAWSPNGVLAFGYASAEGKGIGTLDQNGDTSDVGCSASSIALGWADADELVVSDGANHYVVASEGCATISRVDARKMHEVAFNPQHPSVAYVLRELEYDRNARQYLPDSSLQIAGVDGSDAKVVAGFKYRPHRPAWSPDGKELAFDANIPGQKGRRLITIYDTEQGTSAYLNASAVEGSINEWDAHWSPRGTSIAYLQGSGVDLPTVVVRPTGGGFAINVGEPGEVFARWIDDAHVVLTDGSNERVVSTDGKTSVRGPDGATVLRLD